MCSYLCTFCVCTFCSTFRYFTCDPLCVLQGFFKANPWFFLAHFVHIVLMEVLAIFVLWYFGTSWLPWLTAVVLLAAMQAQAGWLQHDFGHLTVCRTSKWNHILHYSVVNFMKGASAYWWNRRHFQHHAKPNVVSVWCSVPLLSTTSPKCFS